MPGAARSRTRRPSTDRRTTTSRPIPPTTVPRITATIAGAASAMRHTSTEMLPDVDVNSHRAASPPTRPGAHGRHPSRLASHPTKSSALGSAWGPCSMRTVRSSAADPPRRPATIERHGARRTQARSLSPIAGSTPPAQSPTQASPCASCSQAALSQITRRAIAASSKKRSPPSGGGIAAAHQSAVGRSPTSSGRAIEGRRRSASPPARIDTCSEQIRRPPSPR